MQHNNEYLRFRLQEREEWLNQLHHYIRQGIIAEFGCGSGFVLERLSADFPKSFLIGVDYSRERLREAVNRDLSNVILINADITHRNFRDGILDTALFVGVLHEVFSKRDRATVIHTLTIAYRLLKKHGVLIVQDFLKPACQQVHMRIKNRETSDRFMRFVREYMARKVAFEKINDTIILDMIDAVEFASKYRSPTEQDWNEEMHETHFCFTETDYATMAHQAGFSVISMQKLPQCVQRRQEVEKDIACSPVLESTWIQGVFKKY